MDERTIGWGTIIMNGFLDYAREGECKEVVGHFSPNEGLEELAEYFYTKHGFQIDNGKLRNIIR